MVHQPGNPTSWPSVGSSWDDLLGPDRRLCAQRRRREQLSLAIDESNPSAPAQWWVNEAVDKEAVEVGCLMLDTIAPTGPSDRDRTALAALAALTAINDSYASCEQYDDIFKKSLFGRTIGAWLSAASSGATDRERQCMENALRVQYRTLTQQRSEQGTAESKRQVDENHRNYREYLRWRDSEGCFYGVMLFCAIAAGIEIHEIPDTRVSEALEAGIVAFDVHSMVRHRSEDETGDILRYLKGTHREQVDAALELIRELHLDLIHAQDIGDREKEFLLRYVTGGTLLAYMPMRWSRTTSLHLAPVEWNGAEWTHVTSELSHAVRYSDLL
ncbi:hypothetical protein [Streptomyces formicae]|uniref:Terpene synthase n=1 Tax=Streptomyces formicae TaxID=1616117 RepID=A0ABY3WVX5_9ACTN|nr:hypothetical protein [Streptomyces formicae]UNM15594.1 hypothetical protein J4032_32735 [Streptomyces formicae]